MLDLVEMIIAIAQAFRSAGVPHSFGGAIALAYYGHARGTRDINIYLVAGDALAARSLLCDPVRA